MKKIATVLLGSLLAIASTGQHYGFASEANGIEIELNKLEQAEAGCRLTFKSSNHLSANLENLSIEVYLLDVKGIALQSIQFAFGAIAASKARFANFDLKDRKCDEIGAIFVNEVKSCKLSGQTAQACPTTLQLRNLTSIKFTDGAS